MAAKLEFNAYFGMICCWNALHWYDECILHYTSRYFFLLFSSSMVSVHYVRHNIESNAPNRLSCCCCCSVVFCVDWFSARTMAHISINISIDSLSLIFFFFFDSNENPLKLQHKFHFIKYPNSCLYYDCVRGKYIHIYRINQIQ